MCFFIPAKPKNKKKDRKTRCWGASSSTSSTRTHSHPPFVPHNPWAQQEHRYVQESKSRNYNGVFEDIHHVQTLKEKLVPHPHPHPAPHVDVTKVVADAMAKAEQQRKERERDAFHENMMQDLKERDERLAAEAKAREKRERKDWEERERRDREVVKATVDPNVQAMRKMFEDGLKAQEERERWERERKEWKEQGRMEALGMIGGVPSGCLPAITYGGYNSGMYGNGRLGLPAPASQALLGWNDDDIEDWKKRFERKTENRLKAIEDDQEEVKRQTMRARQLGGCRQYS